MAAIAPPTPATTAAPQPAAHGVQLSKFTYGATDLLKNEAVSKRLVRLMNDDAKFEITHENLGVPPNNLAETCYIIYTTESNGQKKARSADHGKTFNFSHDISSITYGGNNIKSAEAFMKILNFMDSTDGFQVTPAVFGKEAANATSDAFVELTYRHAGISREQTVRTSDYLNFANGNQS